MVQFYEDLCTQTLKLTKQSETPSLQTNTTMVRYEKIKKIYSVSISITSLFDTVVNLPTVDELSDTYKNRS